MPEKNRIPSSSDSVQLCSFAKVAARGAPQPSGNSTCHGPSRVLGAGVCGRLERVASQRIQAVAGRRGLPCGTPQTPSPKAQAPHAVRCDRRATVFQSWQALRRPESGHQNSGASPLASAATRNRQVRRLRLLGLVADEIELRHRGSSDGRSPGGPSSGSLRPAISKSGPTPIFRSAALRSLAMTNRPRPIGRTKTDCRALFVRQPTFAPKFIGPNAPLLGFPSRDLAGPERGSAAGDRSPLPRQPPARGFF